jgi:hypothetical protein
MQMLLAYVVEHTIHATLKNGKIVFSAIDCVDEAAQGNLACGSTLPRVFMAVREYAALSMSITSGNFGRKSLLA